ncbi:MAG: carboxylating nicotinate-nucleotide diphosphorylase [Mariprofundales bacterium]|nr:carboxylating nicotinate-nucleotide diphosphorylase [Mariprofundales bacterium]
MNTVDLITLALAEDAANHDITAQATIGVNLQASARIIAKAKGVLSGVGLARQLFSTRDPELQQVWPLRDGQAVQGGDVVATITGSARSILSAERVALNFLQHLSGIATATHAVVQRIADTHCTVADTRKTTPGLRALEKQAVVHGGGINHRPDLAGGFLIKENHIAATGSIAEAIARCRASAATGWIEVECETLDEVSQAVACAPEMILLDNMTPDQVAAARALVPESITLEASGGITAANARDYALRGVDRIAMGSITHSAAALDLSLLITTQIDSGFSDSKAKKP